MHSGEMRLHRTFSQECLQLGHKSGCECTLFYSKLLFIAFSSRGRSR